MTVLMRNEKAAPQPGGLYVHVPFCHNKCGYCDFFSITDTNRIPQFIDALVAEMALKSRSAIRYDTLYIGGGTPSVLAPIQIGRIVSAAFHYFDIDSDAEITLEVNPGTLKMRYYADCLDVGINRINIGVQSFTDEHLEFLGRIHTEKEARQAIKAAIEAGFDQVGVDLIYGIPGQSNQSWLADLELAVDFKPNHLSCYMLTIEPGTPMDRDRLRGRFQVLDEKSVAKLFESTQSYLSASGYSQYEISNFAGQPSARARHNSKYWALTSYDGLGPSAHSFRTPVRWWNHRSVSRYVEDIGLGKVPVAGKEVLGVEQQTIERIYLGLRTKEGIDVAALNRRLKSDFYEKFSEVIEALESEGMLDPSPTFCALTQKGMRYHEGIAKMFIEYV